MFISEDISSRLFKTIIYNHKMIAKKTGCEGYWLT